MTNPPSLSQTQLDFEPTKKYDLHSQTDNQTHTKMTNPTSLSQTQLDFEPTNKYDLHSQADNQTHTKMTIPTSNSQTQLGFEQSSLEYHESMTYFAPEIFKHILEYCDDRIEQKRDRMWKGIRIERTFFEKGNSYDRYGYHWDDSPENIHYIAIGNNKYSELFGKVMPEVSPIWKQMSQ